MTAGQGLGSCEAAWTGLFLLSQVVMLLSISNEACGSTNSDRSLPPWLHSASTSCCYSMAPQIPLHFLHFYLWGFLEPNRRLCSGWSSLFVRAGWARDHPPKFAVLSFCSMHR
jgi:hypothetical protein